MLTKNDLQQIREILGEEVQDKLGILETSISYLKIDVSSIKISVSTLKTDVKNLQKDTKLLKKQLSKVSKDVSVLMPYFDKRIIRLENDMKLLRQN